MNAAMGTNLTVFALALALLVPLRAAAVDVAVPPSSSSSSSATTGITAETPSVPTPAQSTTAPTPAIAAPKPAVVRVSVQTDLGTIVLELEKDRAPITTANFLRYAKEKRFDGTTFYRAMKIGAGDGLIQAGTSGNPKRNLKPIKHEPTTLTGLSHVEGAVSMARGTPGTAAGDFFIVIGTLSSLDADPSQSGDNFGYAVFGHVVAGMETVLRIGDAPTSATQGDGAMKGQMIAAPIKIIAVKRLP